MAPDYTDKSFKMRTESKDIALEMGKSQVTIAEDSFVELKINKPDL
jgi:hypothetical protein